MEQERGISITSSVLHFDYAGFRINLLDTVLVEGDSLSAWLFTSKTGKVMRKSEKNLNRDKVKSHFLRFSSAYQRNVNNYAAVFHYAASSKVRATCTCCTCGAEHVSLALASVHVQIFTAEELNTAMLSPLDTVLALQPYALPRGGTSGYSNFRHEYSIYGGNKDVVPVNNTFKYCESLPGEGAQLVRSKDSRVNAALEEMAVAVVRCVTGCGGGYLPGLRTSALAAVVVLWASYVG